MNARSVVRVFTDGAEQIEGDPIDSDPEPMLDLLEDLGPNLLEQFAPEIVGNIDVPAAFAIDDMEMRMEVRVVAGRAAGHREAATQARVTERFERVVDGGQTQSAGVVLDDVVQFLRGRVGTGRGEGAIDRQSLLGATQPSLGEQFSNLLHDRILSRAPGLHSGGHYRVAVAQDQ